MSEQNPPQKKPPAPQTATPDKTVKNTQNALRATPEDNIPQSSGIASGTPKAPAIKQGQQIADAQPTVQAQPLTHKNQATSKALEQKKVTETPVTPVPMDQTYQDPLERSITPRHRRLALRQIRQMGLNAENGDDALRQLSARGIDILDYLERNASKIQKGRNQSFSASEDQQNVVDAEDTSHDNSPNLGALPVPKEPADTAQRQKKSPQDILEERTRKVAAIQRDLVRRRRKRLRALALRLIVLVFLPTALVSYYYWVVASDMFETNSAFVIQKSDSPGGAGGLGDILAGTGFANSQDSIVVQDYLQSRDAFNRLEQDHNFTAHFKNPKLDSVQRLAADASLDKSYALYQNVISIGYDPTEGLIRMTVIASDPQTSQKFSEALVSYAEERVDGLTHEARGDQLLDAEKRYKVAEIKRLAAQQQVLELQQQRGVLSADVELQLQMQIINQLEVKAETQRLSLAELLDNASPRQSNVGVLQREISRLEERIKIRRADLTEASEGSISLARVGAELLAAETELATRQLLEQESLSALEISRLEADRQSRYLSLAYSPVAPVDATYPKKFENTILAFLVFGGIYIMLSLTVSILREQMSV